MVDFFYQGGGVAGEMPVQAAAAPIEPVAVAPTYAAPRPLPLPVEAASEEPEPSPRKRHKRWPWVLGLAVIVGLVIAFIKLANSPAEGVALSTTQVKVSNTVRAKPVSWIGLDGRYYAFSYPDNLSARVSGEKGSLESYLFYANDHGGWQLATEATDDSLSSASAVRYRQLHSDLYQQTSRQANGLNFMVFTKINDGWEATAFVQHGEVLASIAMSDQGGNDHTDDFERIIKSFQFK